MSNFKKNFEYMIEADYRDLKDTIERLTIESKKGNIYSAIIKAKDINEVLNIGEDNIGNQIFLLDTSYKVLGRSRKAYKNNESIEECNGEEYLLIDKINIMKKEKCIDTIYKTDGAFFYDTGTESGKKFIFCPVRNNNITVAYISVLEEIKFNASDLELVNALSEVISIEFEMKNIFINTSGLQEEYYLKDLLTK